MSDEIAAPHESALWKIISGMRNGPVDERLEIARIEADMEPSYGCPIEIVALWDGPVVITLRRPDGVEERPVTASECETISAALDKAGFGVPTQADQEACCKAFIGWFEANKEFIEDRGTFANVRALVSMGFKAGWAAHKDADVWE